MSTRRDLFRQSTGAMLLAGLGSGVNSTWEDCRGTKRFPAEPRSEILDGQKRSAGQF